MWQGKIAEKEFEGIKSGYDITAVKLVVTKISGVVLIITCFECVLTVTASSYLNIIGNEINFSFLTRTHLEPFAKNHLTPTHRAEKREPLKLTLL